MIIAGRLTTTTLLVLLSLTAFFSNSAAAASVKPLEVFSERILVVEIEYLANEHSLASARLRKSVDRLNREMNIMSKERIKASLNLLDKSMEALTAARKSSAALSTFMLANTAQLKAAGHGKYLPLATIDAETEKPYHDALEKFLASATVFVRYCDGNLEAISTGQKAENKRYDELYAAYLKEMETFNSQSIDRSQTLAEIGTEHPVLWDLMPR